MHFSFRSPKNCEDSVNQRVTKTSSQEADREVLRCQACGLVQYRTKTDNCRRCMRLLPVRITFVIPTPPPPEVRPEQAESETWPNQAVVEEIGVRVRRLRESRAITQSQLQTTSGVSRSYLSRIESGQMTPSLGTLEKIAEALGVGLNRFFVPESNGETVLEDPFIRCLQPFLRQLEWSDWQSILKRLQAISDSVTSGSSICMQTPIGADHMHGMPRRHNHASVNLVAKNSMQRA